MKKTVIIIFISLLILTGCKKKEEPKPFPSIPSTSPILENRILQLKETIRQNPKDVNAQIELGNIYMDTHRFADAIEAYSKALEIDPNNVNVRVDMGTCYRSIGKPERAAEEYRKAISINPNHANAHRNLGVVLAFDFKRKSEAVKEFEQYLALLPNAPDAPKVRDLIAKLKK
jgi:Tfp pilus assembly protein PilF